MKFDKNFILELKKQNQNMFNKFYLQTVDMFFRYLNGNFFLNKKECEDIISTFFMKLRKALPQYKESMSFEAYMRTIFKNTTKDYFKKNKEISFSQLETKENSNSFQDKIEDEKYSINEFLELDFQIKEIKDSLRILDGISQDIIHRKFIESKSHKEIANLLNISEDNVRQKLSRAIKKIKENLKK